MCEYVAKYNIGGAETGSSSASWKMTGFRYTDNDLPYTTYTNCSGSWDTISAQEEEKERIHVVKCVLMGAGEPFGAGLW